MERIPVRKFVETGAALLLLGGVGLGWAHAEREAQKPQLISRTGVMEIFIICNPPNQTEVLTARDIINDELFISSPITAYTSGLKERMPAVMVKVADWKQSEIYDLKTFEQTGIAKKVDIRINESKLGNYSTSVLSTITQYNPDYMDYLKKRDVMDRMMRMISPSHSSIDSQTSLLDMAKVSAFCPTRIPDGIKRLASNFSYVVRRFFSGNDSGIDVQNELSFIPLPSS
ncbi:MAG: hypothetical protein Q8P92_01305 [Candidatus Daviesbacteria bacterium]|nr:hypothetical protein [Candidatus Daviesbacteria bacterium]